MADYRSKLLEVVNQQGYRLPEPQVFAALEEFKAQVNQVLAYKGLRIHFRHNVADTQNPNNDGGSIILGTTNRQFISTLASWTYGHPFHVFPIKLRFGDAEFECATEQDVEIALVALIQSDMFYTLVNSHHL